MNDEDEDNLEPDWGKPSRAVIACAPGGTAIVVWHVGAHVRGSYEGVGSWDVDELGFEETFPIGISVWEGKLRGGNRYYTLDGVDYEDVTLRGNVRRPTDEEWAAIRLGQCPWNYVEWMRVVPREQGGP